MGEARQHDLMSKKYRRKEINFAPQKYFIGLMDFFSILLPGTLLTWLLMGGVGPVVLGDRYAKLDGPQAWAACCPCPPAP